MTGYVRFKVSTTLLEQALKLPPGVYVETVQTSGKDYDDRVVEVLVSGEMFAPVPLTGQVPEVSPVCRRVTGRIDWEFGDVKVVGA